ncbi:MAG: sialate O-acetylesterase [Bacteroides sp.]|nr:sialate O-acetylesterase [Bacteroides sp.]
MRVFFKVWLVVFILCFTLPGEAKVNLPQLISDGMVLQRGAELTLWGDADPGEEVTVIFLKKRYITRAGSDGKWEVKMPAQKSGGPYTMTINDIHIDNILIGDVYLCSGQSNMELPVSRVMDLFKEEVEGYKNPMIRQFKVWMDYNFHSPQEDVKKSGWSSLNPENALNFSAVAYFFAKDLYSKTGIPVGILNSSVGGSPVEAWISEEELKPFPEYYNEIEICRDDQWVANVKRLDNETRDLWNRVFYQRDPGSSANDAWYRADLDDSSWQSVDMFSTSWNNDGLNPVNGSDWFRKEFTVPASLAGQEGVIRLGCIVDADSVFINGTFVGTTSYMYPPRIYRIPAGLLQEGENHVTVRMISYNGAPHFVKDKPYKILVGEEEISLLGEWRYKRGTEMPPLSGGTFFNYKPAGLYNSMIAPLTPYAVAGVLWYQGESNSERYNEYSDLLSTLIANWRSDREDPQLPFFIVQLPNFMEEPAWPGYSQWAEMRAAQERVTREIPHTALIVTIDAGEWNDIHPLNKKDIGIRISRQAQKLIYGDRKVVVQGPVYRAKEIEGDKVILTFEEDGGTLQPESVLKGFAIAGADGKFVWAQARTEGDKVIVWADEVTQPVMVRYAWADNPGELNLRNTEGLPAAPFRTDY